MAIIMPGDHSVLEKYGFTYIFIRNGNIADYYEKENEDYYIEILFYATKGWMLTVSNKKTQVISRFKSKNLKNVLNHLEKIEQGAVK
ncbi:hypothetical protein [Macrococcus capreoli]|uniref:hypothetical protein n=1 Tax=Macrococcus capreoli TaxID=2982690 RepID=UPI003F41C91F